MKIVTCHFNEDLNWLKKATHDVVVITKEGGTKPAIPATYKIPNSGKEASVYLHYIVENYDNLPDTIAFFHGHEHSYHHYFGHLLDLIDKANMTDFDFVSLNGQKELWYASPYLCKTWSRLFEPYLNMPLPDNMNHDGYAQFVVNKNRILKHPKEAYQLWLDFTLCKFPELSDGMPDLQIGTIFENIWHIIFGEQLTYAGNSQDYYRERFLS